MTRPPRGCISSGQDHERGNVIWGTRWEVAKEFRDSAGLAFVQRYLSRFDFSDLEWITLRRSLQWYFGYGKQLPHFGQCWYPHGTSSGLFRINCNVLDVLARARYPVQLLWPDEEPSSSDRRAFFVDDENEVVIGIIAHEVSHYLGSTGQIPANGDVHSGGLQSTSEAEANDFLKAAVEAYRRRDYELPGTLARAGWCVVCGKPLSKGGGAQSFCTDRCRTGYHNSLRGARIAARRGEMECEMCRTKFRPARSDARTCSAACRQKKYRKDRQAHNSSSAQLLKNAQVK
jgi:predicted nucleic acid-binding Zn ribbon protein